MYWSIKFENLQIGREESHRREYVLRSQSQYFQFPEQCSTWDPWSRMCHNSNYSFLFLEYSFTFYWNSPEYDTIFHNGMKVSKVNILRVFELQHGCSFSIWFLWLCSQVSCKLACRSAQSSIPQMRQGSGFPVGRWRTQVLILFFWDITPCQRVIR